MVGVEFLINKGVSVVRIGDENMEDFYFPSKKLLGFGLEMTIILRWKRLREDLCRQNYLQKLFKINLIF